MNIVFRVDSSLDIGAGHVMRCLAIANSLRSKNGVVCKFICRNLLGNLIEFITKSGYEVIVLPSASSDSNESNQLELSDIKKIIELKTDLTETKIAIQNLTIDLLVIDSYDIGVEWENEIRQLCDKIVVIDDLANRAHNCDILLDQNLGRNREDYNSLVPKSCMILTGPSYALLRPEFLNWRDRTDVRKKLSRILVFFGGGDPTNETQKALLGIINCKDSFSVDVVIGSSNPNREKLERLLAPYSDKCSLYVQTDNMAELMSYADLAIGAAGSASWERCCLKLPSVLSVLAENQKLIAEELNNIEAAINLGNADSLTPEDYTAAVSLFSQEMLSNFSKNASQIADGRGVDRLVNVVFGNLFGKAV